MKDKKQPKEKLKSQSSNGSVDEKELIFQSSNDLMMYIDKFGKLLKINKAGLAFSGFSEKEVIGKMFWKLPGVLSTRNAPKYLKVFKNALKGKPTRNFVGKLDDKSGKTHIMDFSAFPVKENKKLKYVFIVAKELTEQKETESRYRLITENTDDLIAVTKFSLNPKYTYISPSHEKIMGYKPEELLGNPCLVLVHPDDKKKLISLLRKYVSVKGKKLFTGKDSDVNAIIEYRAKDKSGNWHYLESTANIMGNELLLVSKDITERKKTEAKLIEREKELRFVTESSLDTIFALARTGKITYISPSAKELFGFEPDEMIGTPFTKYVPKEELPKYWKALKNVILHKKIPGFETYIKDRKGNLIPVEINGRTVEREGKLVAQGTIRDITERKKAEEELRLFSQAAESSPDGVAMGNFEGRITYVNETFVRMFGYSKEELMGKEIASIYSKDQIPKLEEALKATMEGGWKGELLGKRKNGGLVPMAISSTVVMDEKGRVIAHMASHRDITEQKKAEESLQKAHDELEERVTERTAELSRINEVLQIEITEHNKAEEEIKRTKDYLDNVIDSASEFMLVVDMNYKVSTWNKTAERLTGYKKREVLRRSINSLDVFLNSKELQDDIKNIQNGVKIPFSELILRSKTGAKKLVRTSGSIVIESGANQTGVLFVGKEITQDSEMRGKLLQGNSYLITDKSNTSALNLLVDLAVSGSDGLFITRGNPDIIQSMFQSVDTKVIMLSRDRYEGFENVSSLGELTAKIKEFVAKKSKPVVLIDRVDYLLTNFSFEAFVKLVYEINNIISTHNAILLMRVNSDILNASRLAFIEEELKPLPSQRIDAVELDDQVYGVLTFIDKQNKNNVLVSFKKISQEFSISKVTTAKRLNMLDDRGLIFIKKQGKSKTVHISDKGKLLLSGREAV